MNAITFIKQHGVEKAREVVEGAPEGATSIIGKMYFRFSDTEYWYWSFNGHKNKGKPEQYFYYQKKSLDISDLMRLVESVDLVKLLGGIEALKALVDISNSPFSLSHITREGVIYSIDEIKQAIADYEAIYSNDVKYEVSFGTSLMQPKDLAFIGVDISDDTETLDHVENHISPNCKELEG